MPSSREILTQVFLKERANFQRFLAARVRNTVLAEDLVQDLYLKISKTTLPETIENPNGFLYRMASNLALDHIRSEQRRRKRDSDWSTNQSAQIGDQPASMATPADEAMFAKQRLAIVMNALETLSPKSREVFKLHKFQNQPYKDIALALNISVSTVEKHMIKALKHLGAAREEGGAND